MAGSLALAGTGAVSGLFPATASAAAKLTLAPLAGELSIVRGGAANIVVARSGDGLLLVDGGAAADVKSLQKLLRQHYPGLPVRHVLNTHWHPAQSGFNATARRQGADVIAHENTRLWLSTTVNSRWEGKVYPPQPTAALPNRTFFYGAQALEFGGRKVEFMHLGQAHTDGDIYVRFAEENVIVGGDVLSPLRYPVIDAASNGWLGGMHGATKKLMAAGDAATKFVPAQGDICSLEQLGIQEEMCYTVVQRIGESYYKGQTYDELVASAPTREFDGRFGDPTQFLRQAYDTAWYHVTEIRRVAR